MLARQCSPSWLVTMVPDAKSSEFLLRADVGEVRNASAWLESACLHHGMPVEQARRLDLCLNEALANIISHGGPSALSAPVHIFLDLHRSSDGNEAAITVTDTGVEFNPLSHRPKPRPQTLEEAVPGGLGITMMHNFSDAMNYRYAEGRNQLTFTVRWTSEG